MTAELFIHSFDAQFLLQCLQLLNYTWHLCSSFVLIIRCHSSIPNWIAYNKQNSPKHAVSTYTYCSNYTNIRYIEVCALYTLHTQDWWQNDFMNRGTTTIWGHGTPVPPPLTTGLHQLYVECRTTKECWPETDVLPLSHVSHLSEKPRFLKTDSSPSRDWYRFKESSLQRRIWADFSQC